MDEMNISTEHIDGLTNFYYEGKEVIIPEEWKKSTGQNWPKNVMAAMGISWEDLLESILFPKE